MKDRLCFLTISALLIFTVIIATGNGEEHQKENISSNILEDYSKRAAAESYILTVESDALQNAYSSGTALLYYDPTSLCAHVDDELTNQYIARQLIYDVDPGKDPREVKELYLNHYYSILFEYVGEYDPNQFSIVDGEPGCLQIKIEYFVIERNGSWEIYSSQYRGCTPIPEKAATENTNKSF